MTFHQLPTGPALVCAAVLAVGSTTAPAYAQDAPPPQEAPAVPAIEQVPCTDASLAQFDVAPGTKLDMDTAPMLLIEAFRLTLGDQIPTGDAAKAAAEGMRQHASIAISGDRSFTVPRWWFDGKHAQLQAGGSLQEPVPQPIQEVDIKQEWDIREEAPTCGPCCHGHCEEEWDLYRPLPPDDGSKKKKKKKKKNEE